MNKDISFGVILLILIISLVGCTEMGIGTTNIGDIKANPDAYIGKTVTIEGNCKGSTVYDDADHTIRFQYSGGSLSGEYRLTGVITENDFGTLFIRVESAKAL